MQERARGQGFATIVRYVLCSGAGRASSELDPGNGILLEARPCLRNNSLGIASEYRRRSSLNYVIGKQ